MTPYAKVLTAKPSRRQLWHISGSVPALVQDAYELALDHVYGAGVSVVKSVFEGSTATYSAIAEELLREYDEERMVVVLHSAEQFKDWDRLAPLLKTADKSRFFIAVSNAAPPSTKEGYGSTFVNSSKARFVVCNEMTPVEKSTWVQTRLNIHPEAEADLIRRSWGDYGWLLNQIRKLEWVAADLIDPHMVKVFCSGSGRPDFVSSLRRSGKGKLPALISLQRETPTRDTLSDLIRDLTRLVILNVEKKSVGLQMRLLAERTGLTPKEISAYGTAHVYYDLQAATRCFTSLSVLYPGLQRGSRLAFLALVARW